MKIRAPVNTNNSLRFIVIPLGSLTLACKIETVHKVINYSQIYSSGLGHTGIIDIDDQTVVVTDLYQKLFNKPLAGQPRYFVIIKSQTGALVAIPVKESPNLIDIQRKYIRVLPEPYRQSDTLALASHVAVIPDKEATLTIFILDENTLV